MEGTNTLLYCFCIINKDQADTSLKSLSGGRVYCVPYKDLYAVVGEADKERYEPVLETLRGHNTIINHYFKDNTVLPMKFSTVCLGEKQVIDILQKYYPQFQKMMCELENKAEMGIKAFCDVKKLVEQSSCNETVDFTGKSEDQDYMLRKYHSYKWKNAAIEPVKRMLREMNEQLKTLSIKCRFNKMNNDNIMLNSAYLIEKDKIEAFGEIVDMYRIKNHELVLVVSGPWAPYNFVSIRKEGDGDESGAY